MKVKILRAYISIILMMAKNKISRKLCNFAYDLLDEHAAFINENNEAIFFNRLFWP